VRLLSQGRLLGRRARGRRRSNSGCRFGSSTSQALERQCIRGHGVPCNTRQRWRPSRSPTAGAGLTRARKQSLHRFVLRSWRLGDSRGYRERRVDAAMVLGPGAWTRRHQLEHRKCVYNHDPRDARRLYHTLSYTRGLRFHRRGGPRSVPDTCKVDCRSTQPGSQAAGDAVCTTRLGARGVYSRRTPAGIYQLQEPDTVSCGRTMHAECRRAGCRSSEILTCIMPVIC
jgi:hypothetical protein